MEDLSTFIRSLNGLLVFVLGNNEFCMNIANVSAVIKPEEINKYCKLYLSKNSRANESDKSFPIINTERCFGFKIKGITSNTRVILIKCSNIIVGMYVDQVKEFISLSRKENEINLNFSTYSINTYLCGQVEYEGQKWMLPDLERICYEMYVE